MSKQGEAAGLASERVACAGFPDAVRMTNGTVELVVVPSIQRILHYGYIGGPNMLWDNSEAARQEPVRAWKNWGGDKVWPWPHQRWEQWIGRMFPPPPGLERAAEVDVLAAGAVRMTGPIDKAMGLRVVREIRLAATGTRAVIINTLEKVKGEPMDCGVWTISQVSDRDDVYCLLPDGQDEPFIKPFGDGGWTCDCVAGRLAHLCRPTEDGGKVGVDGCGLAVVDGGCAMLQWPVADSGDAKKIIRGERVQFYAHGRSEAGIADPAGYLELEFSSEIQRLEPGMSASMTVAWALRPVSDDDPAVVAAMLDASIRDLVDRG
jgi:hypothetical protein